MNLTIGKIKTKNKDQILPSPLPEVLPIHPFRVLCSGRSGSGKSNLILTLITDKRFYGGKNKYFDLIFVFSGSADTDDAYDVLKGKFVKKEHMFSTLDIDNLDKIWKIQNKIVKTQGVNNAPKILLLFDDVIDSANINNRVFQKIFYRGRHISISCMVLTQKYNKIPFSLREQMTNIFLFKPSKKELKTIVEEITPPQYAEKQMEEIIMHCTQEPFSFFHYDRKKDITSCFKKGLDTIVRVR